MATPTLVQHKATGYENVVGAGTFTINLPNTVLANNLLLIGFEYDSGLTISSVKDDGGNVFTAGPSTNNTGNSLKIASYYIANNTFSSKKILVAFTGTPVNAARFLADVSEWYNVATTTPTDGSSSSASSKSAGSITTTVNGDLVWQFGVDISDNTNTVSQNPSFNGTSITAGSGFTLLASDLQAGMCAQYQVQSTAGAINPTFTTSGAATWGSVALAFKSASAGTAPSATAMRIVNEYHTCQPTSTALPSLALPTQGNLLVALWTSGDVYITAATDSASNTWTTYTGIVASQQFVNAQILFAQNASTSNSYHNLSLTYNTTTAGQNVLVVYDIVNAATSNVLASASRQISSQSSNANLSSVAVSPASSNGIAFATMAIQFHTINALTTSGGILDAVVNSFDDNGGTGTGNSTLDEDNAYGHVYNTNLNQITFTWGYNHSKNTTNAGVGNYSSVAACFNPSGSSATLPVMVQTPVNGTAASGTAVTATFGSATTTHNTIVAVSNCSNASGSPTVSNLSVTGGSATFTKVVGIGGGSTTLSDNEVWAAANVTGGTTAVTVNLSGATTSGDLVIYELTNMPTSWTADTTASGNGSSSTSLTTSAFTTTNSNDFIIAAFAVQQTGKTAEALFDNLITTDNTSVVEWESVSSTQSAVSLTGTQAPAGTYNYVVAALQGIIQSTTLRIQITGTITTSATTLNVRFPVRPSFPTAPANLISTSGIVIPRFTPIRPNATGTITTSGRANPSGPIQPGASGIINVRGTFATKMAQRAPINTQISLTNHLQANLIFRPMFPAGLSTSKGVITVRFANIIRPTAIGSIAVSGVTHGSLRVFSTILLTGSTTVRNAQRAPVNAPISSNGVINVRFMGTVRQPITGLSTSSGVAAVRLIGQMIFPTASGSLNTSTANTLNVRLINKLEIVLSTVPIVLTGVLTVRFQIRPMPNGKYSMFGFALAKNAIRLSPLLTGSITASSTTFNVGRYIYPRPSGLVGLSNTVLNVRETGNVRLVIVGSIVLVNKFLQVGIQPTRVQLVSKVIAIFNTTITPRFISPIPGIIPVTVTVAGYYVILDAWGLFQIMYMVPGVLYNYAAKQVLYGPYATYQLAFPQLFTAFQTLTQD